MDAYQKHEIFIAIEDLTEHLEQDNIEEFELKYKNGEFFGVIRLVKKQDVIINPVLYGLNNR